MRRQRRKKQSKQKYVIGLLLACVLIAIPVFVMAVDNGVQPVGSSAQGYKAVGLSDEVSAYRAAVEKECAAQGISAYKEVLLAVMMQETGGSENDVMVAAARIEGVDAQTILPEESIAQAVGYFKSLVDLGDEKQVDFDAVLQAYDYGEGYIEYVYQNGGFHSQGLADGYAELQKQQLQVDEYGNSRYVPLVYRYLERNNGLGGVDLIADEYATQVVSHVQSRVGDPYSQELRGQGSYIDCSGLTQWSYRKIGVSLPNTAADQAAYAVQKGLTVATDSLMPGDLLFYSYEENGRYMNISHVAMYVGGGKMVDASSSNGQVVYRNVGASPVLCARPHLALSVEPGWKDLGYGNWCYYGEDQAMLSDSWIAYMDKWYYLGSDGLMLWECWQQIGGEWYYFDATGAMVTGEHSIDGQTNQFADSGEWIGYIEMVEETQPLEPEAVHLIEETEAQAI